MPRRKPCPFCGSYAPILRPAKVVIGWILYCTTCNAHGPLSATKDAAKRNWDERLTPEAARTIYKHMFKLKN